MSEEAVRMGNEFGKAVIDTLCSFDLPREGRAAFYATEIGVQMGNIAADIGRDAAITILDAIRALMQELPEKRHMSH